jgi:hypothetical protein
MVHRATVIVLIIGLHLGLTASGQTQQSSIDDAEPALHEELLEYLRDNSEVLLTFRPDLHPVRTVFNGEAIIPPQCYTRTEGRFNPCYVCHQNPVPGRENVMSDGPLQVEYSFSDVGMENHWRNLFEDRSEAVSAMSDDDILAWVEQDNYSRLAGRLEQAGFEGWIPDLANLHLAGDAFDEEGFALDGSNWVAFNYKPLPSTFWPTNGSTDDVMIRLAEAYRTDVSGNYSSDIYKANLAIVEANIKGLTSITTVPIDERSIGVDLNQDGSLGVIDEIHSVGRYVGAAETQFMDTFLYPQGTEFLHTVRYLGVAPNGDIVPSTRIKEVRYMRKWVDYNKPVYARYYQEEAFSKELGRLPGYIYLGDWGLDNGFGWSIQGFIEDARGELRELTYEENLFCMGCHTSVGATIDKTFAFPRKVDGADGWRYIDLKGMPDAPNVGEIQGEISTYLERVGGGGEFRSNPEMLQRWFHADGTVDHDRLSQAEDVYEIITPSVERALELNKAYRAIVADQDYLYGRDATVSPPINVYDRIDNETAPTLPASRFYQWDIRLDWTRAAN